MSNADRIAEEMRILRAARDDRLYLSGHGRWMIASEARPSSRARQYLERSGLLHHGSITDKGRRMLVDHGC